MKTVSEKETIGTRIKKIRVNKNVTISELSKLTQISQASLYEYENKSICLSVKEIAKISQALNVTSDYVLGRIDKETNDLIILNRHKLDK